MSDIKRCQWFMPVIVLGGLVFGFGLAYSHMARPEVVLDFLQLKDLGLLFVMGGAAVVTGVTFAIVPALADQAPITRREYTRRLKSFDHRVLLGGAIFGAGWGLSGVCPGSAYASIGIGNYPMIIAVGGMFLGAYAQGLIRSYRADTKSFVVDAD